MEEKNQNPVTKSWQHVRSNTSDLGLESVSRSSRHRSKPVTRSSVYRRSSLRSSKRFHYPVWKSWIFRLDESTFKRHLYIIKVTVKTASCLIGQCDDRCNCKLTSSVLPTVFKGHFDCAHLLTAWDRSKCVLFDQERYRGNWHSEWDFKEKLFMLKNTVSSLLPN